VVAVVMGGIEASGGVIQRRHDLPDAAVDVFKGFLFLMILASETYVARAQGAVQRWVAANVVPEPPPPGPAVAVSAPSSSSASA
jgi:simple sugar transport system permease protein